ncbi:unnamed protein product [Phytomonas sp. EM1]|nr:unnamed protein product [Phytomonas sp. EM1]|eukprot:CCW62625.1 unnamed protein product [Phytomonas sp. isolate EM1]
MAFPIILGILTGAAFFYTMQLAPRIIQRVAMAQCSPLASAAASSIRGAAAPYRIYEYGFKKTMSEREAYMLLGFDGWDLGLFSRPPEEEVKRRYRELMKELHTDVGGSPYIATKLNEAKDILTRQPTDELD